MVVVEHGHLALQALDVIVLQHAICERGVGLRIRGWIESVAMELLGGRTRHAGALASAKQEIDAMLTGDVDYTEVGTGRPWV